jgi:hypothetical protein
MPLANSYMDVAEFKSRTVASSNLVDGAHIPADWAVERAAWVTFVESRLVIETSKINARLRKRYAVPFTAPVPEIVLGWLAALVTPKLFERRGWDPSDKQAEIIIGDATAAAAEILEAANSDVGLFDLPLRQDNAETGIVHGGPFGYSEASPYVWTDEQIETVRG